MKNWLHLLTIVLSIILIVPELYAQEDASGDNTTIEQSTEPAVAGEVLPTMEEIERRKALLEIRKQELALEKEEQGSGGWLFRFFPHGMGLQMIMPFAAFLFVLGILSIIFGYERKKDQNRHETIRVYLEKGMEVPPELLIDEDHPHAKKAISDYRKGIIWTVVGIGISITALIILGSDRGAALGLIPVCIGVGYLLAAKLDPKTSKEQ